MQYCIFRLREKKRQNDQRSSDHLAVSVWAGWGIVKLRLTAVFDAQHGGFATGWSPVSWGLFDELFVNLTMPSGERYAMPHAGRDEYRRCCMNRS